MCDAEGVDKKRAYGGGLEYEGRREIMTISAILQAGPRKWRITSLGTTKETSDGMKLQSKYAKERSGNANAFSEETGEQVEHKCVGVNLSNSRWGRNLDVRTDELLWWVPFVRGPS
jgi:hypothetical protein